MSVNVILKLKYLKSLIKPNSLALICTKLLRDINVPKYKNFSEKDLVHLLALHTPSLQTGTTKF